MPFKLKFMESKASQIINQSQLFPIDLELVWEKANINYCYIDDQ